MKRVRFLPLAAFLVLGAMACGGLPEAPEWDVVIAAPFDADDLGVRDFLPDGADTTRVGTGKLFALPDFTGAGELGFSSICPSCPSGSTTALPAFDYAQAVVVSLTDDVVRLEVVSASVRITATNGLGFTMLGATGDGSGAFSVAVYDDATNTELGRDVVTGPGSEWAPGEMLEVLIPIDPSMVTFAIRVELSLASPALTFAQPVVVSPDDAIAVEGALTDLLVAGISVRVDGLEIRHTSPVDLNLSNETEDVVDERLLGAQVEFELRHDLAVSGPFVVTIADSEGALFGGDPAREIVLGDFDFQPGTVQTASIDAATVQRLIEFEDPWIGYSAVATGTLSVPPGAGPVTRLHPDSRLGTRVRVATTFRVGG